MILWSVATVGGLLMRAEWSYGFEALRLAPSSPYLGALSVQRRVRPAGGGGHLCRGAGEPHRLGHLSELGPRRAPAGNRGLKSELTQAKQNDEQVKGEMTEMSERIERLEALLGERAER